MKRVIIGCLSILCLSLILMGCGKESVKVTVVSEESSYDSVNRIEEEISDDPQEIEICNEEESDEDRIIRVETSDSTCFSEIGYDEYRGVLYVTFRSSGASYVYSEVPNEVWKSLLNAESKGSYYNKEIKGQFPCKKQ